MIILEILGALVLLVLVWAAIEHARGRLKFKIEIVDDDT